MARHASLTAALAALAAMAAPVLATAAVPADDPAVVAFQKYWSAYVSGDYVAAADMMCPKDLQGMRSDLLPVFESLGSGTEADARQMYEAFFAGVPANAHADLSDRDVFLQLLKFVAVASPQSIEVLHRARVEPQSLAVDANDKTLVSLTYKLLVDDVSETDTQQLRHFGPVWCLLPKERPADTAARFRKLFAK